MTDQPNDVYQNAGGWGLPGSSRKWHWFHGGKWAFAGNNSDRNAANSDCCKGCEKKLTKH